MSATIRCHLSRTTICRASRVGRVQNKAKLELEARSQRCHDFFFLADIYLSCLSVYR